MKAVLSMGWPLILFRAGAEALPYAPRAVLPLLVLNLLVSAGIQQLADPGLEKPVLSLSALALVAEAAWLGLILRRAAVIHRWVQAFTALVLIDTFIALLAALPTVLLLQAGEAFLPVTMGLQTVMALWSLSVRGRVYAETLAVPRWRGVLMALAPLFLTMLLALPLLPDLLPAAPAAATAG